MECRHAQKLNNSLLRFIINSVQPLSIVEDEDFIKYSHDLDPKYKLPCKPALKIKLMKFIIIILEKFNKKLVKLIYLIY